MARIFVYDGREFTDPGPDLTVKQVQEQLGTFFGEIVGTKVSETTRGNDTIYTFQKRVGTKGNPQASS